MGERAALDEDAIVVGHSVGGAVLLRQLPEAKVDKPIGGIFVIAAPFWGAEEYQAHLPAGVPVFVYHGRDDETVPFAHLAQFAQKFPQATVREVDECGHQFNDDLSVAAKEIKELAGDRGG